MTDIDIDPDDEAAGVPEGMPHEVLDVIVEHWPRIAAAAWDGWRTRGRGTVTIEAGSLPPCVEYRVGSPCPCHRDAVAAYDPATQAVVAVVRTDDAEVVWHQTLGGWPSPEQAAAECPGAARGKTVH